MEYLAKEAKLFEAGNYPDKDLEITEEQLDEIISNSEGTDIPIKIEHEDSPFDFALGTVSKLWRVGKELFGQLSINSNLWNLMDQVGNAAKKLSIGLDKQAMQLKEVSIVSLPRVKTARVFKEEHLSTFAESGEIIETGEQEEMPEVKTFSEAEIEAIKSEYENKLSVLEQKLAAIELDKKVEALMSTGLIKEDAKETAIKILSFGAEVAEAFEAYLKITFSEQPKVEEEVKEEVKAEDETPEEVVKEEKESTNEDSEFSERDKKRIKSIGLTEDQYILYNTK